MAAVIQTSDMIATVGNEFGSDASSARHLGPRRLRLVTLEASETQQHAVPATQTRDSVGHPLAATYARRRLGALVVLIAAVLAIAGGAVALAASLTFPGGAPLSAPGTTTGSPGSYDIGSSTESPLAVSVAETHVVQPGDTLWSIARSLINDSSITDDHGAVVADLVELNGGAGLVVGQQIVLPVRSDLAFDRP